MFTVAPISPSLEWVPFVLKSTSWGSQLEWPQEVICFLEVWADCMDFVDQVFKGSNAVLAQTFLNQTVIGEGNSLLVDFSKTSFVDQSSNCFSGRISELVNNYPKAT